MKELIINDTPVRTSENYQINNVKINCLISEKNSLFYNCFLEDFDFEHIKISSVMDDFYLTYGTGKVLEKQVKEMANVKMKLEIIGNSTQENIINFIFDEQNQYLVDNIQIVASDDCKCNVTIRYAMDYNNNEAKYFQYKNGNVRRFENTNISVNKKNEKTEYYHNGIINVKMNHSSELNLNLVNLLGMKTSNIISMENCLMQNAKLNYNIIDFGGNSSVTNYYTNLLGDESENNLNTIYLGKAEKVIDMNYIATTYGKETKVKIDAQGAIKDSVKKHFKGTIDFRRGGKKAIGSENEFCMLLSDEAKSINLPMLLCDEEDVVGNHATAAGKVNNKELFYLMSRGLTEKEAKVLLIKARFNKVIEEITNENLKAEILNTMENDFLV